jgi:glutathione peroxidase
LEALYEKYKDHLVVVGFPANNFGGQEPGSNTEIKEFCKKKIMALVFQWPLKFL